MPAEPLFLPETPKIPALSGPHLDKYLKLISKPINSKNSWILGI
jgi:hypothetical protein